MRCSVSMSHEQEIERLIQHYHMGLQMANDAALAMSITILSINRM